MKPIEAARQYWRRGWNPIPLRYASKAPALPEGHGLLGRRATPQELKSFSWEGVGIVTGSLSGIVVLDIDGDRGQQTMAENGFNTEFTVIAKTPNGWHHYFKYTDDIARNYIGTVGPGVDIKSNGGYVVAPPSVHPSGEKYKWADDASPEEVELADPPMWMRERASAAGNFSTPWDFGGAVWGEGVRNTNMASLAGTMFSRGFGYSSVLSICSSVNRENCEPPMQDAEVREVVDKIARYHGG